MIESNVKQEIKNANTNLLKNTQISWWQSWPIIIAVFIIFWPVGIFLLIQRINIDKKTALLSGKLIAIMGGAAIALAIVGIIVSTSQGMGKDDLGTILFLLIAGVALILLGKKTVKDAEIYKKYIDIVVNQEITSIDNIAAALNVPYESSQEQLQKMVKKGYFEGAYIDTSAREIVLSKKHFHKENEKMTESTDNMEVVSCKNCGANNKIAKGIIGECEYCGSYIGK